MWVISFNLLPEKCSQNNEPSRILKFHLQDVTNKLSVCNSRKLQTRGLLVSLLNLPPSPKLNMKPQWNNSKLYVNCSSMNWTHSHLKTVYWVLQERIWFMKFSKLSGKIIIPKRYTLPDWDYIALAIMVVYFKVVQLH